jgi:two-component system, OmpR family, sensor histidine kinase BaeS
MPDHRSAPRARRGSLAARLALAFVLVGVCSAAIVIAVVAFTSRRETTALSSAGRTQVAGQVSRELAAAYEAAGDRWTGADLEAAVRTAVGARAALILRDADGTLVAVTSPSGVQRATGGTTAPANLPLPGAAARISPVTSGSLTVGRAELRFAGSGLTGSEERLRDALVRAAVLAALAAALLALLVAAFVTRRLRDPLRRLARAAERLEAGDANARVDAPNAPGELGEVAVAFDHMADTLSRQHEARAAMLSDLAHELRTPLTILRGGLEELIDGEVAASPAELSSLQEEVLRVERLTADIWQLSESEPAYLQLQRSAVDLGTVALEATRALQASAAAAEVRLVVDAGEAGVQGDRQRLVQVATNLVSNAIKFTPAGGEVRIRTAVHDGQAELSVVDSGPGIGADELPRVFERFWRGRAAQGIGGTGVGLAVVQRLVTAHGGVVRAESPAGGGARFTVRLPLG